MFPQEVFGRVELCPVLLRARVCIHRVYLEQGIEEGLSVLVGQRTDLSSYVLDSHAEILSVFRASLDVGRYIRDRGESKLERVMVDIL